MKTMTKGAIIAITTAALGTTAMLPAYAQPFGGERGFTQRIEGGHAHSFRPVGPGAAMMGQRGNLLEVLLSGRGAEAMDVAAVRLMHQLSLDAEQQALLEDLRLAALGAVEELQTAREEMAQVTEAQDAPDLVARYSGLVAMTTARADALEAMQPAYEAFVGSLNEEQISALAPQRGAATPPLPEDGDAGPALTAPGAEG